MRKDFPQLAQIESAHANGNSRSRTLFGLDAEALSALMVEAGEPAWRGRQLAEALYRQRIAELDAITTLPMSLRQRLTAEGWQLGRPVIAQAFHSIDGTERYLVQLADGLTVETVWMPEGDGGESGDNSDAEIPQLPKDCHPERAQRVEGSAVSPGAVSLGAVSLGAPSIPRSSAEWVGSHEPHKATICISSQIGCAVNCQFCLTAKLGLQRNLTAGEIAGQVLAVFERHAVEVGRDRVNLVFMGMGEPFLNYDNFIAAVRLLVRQSGLSPRRMTVSTSGIVPGIERFAAEPLEFRPKLAISLNAPNDAIRSEIMPINRKWPIAAVIDAVRRLELRPRERLTFEYVLLGGTTDRPEDARELARLIRRTGLAAKVNLIAWNPGPGITYTTPQPEAVEAFRNALIQAGIPTYLRKPRGRDIYAACGQLKRTVES
ncbi:MAG: 23S rRNA (adenine(2503)-C(2))-methyltransferase RlmN [Terracidiphilus sp.]|jgi:23S rRNA (adenine2503-C2)-methyltransferase